MSNRCDIGLSISTVDKYSTVKDIAVVATDLSMLFEELVTIAKTIELKEEKVLRLQEELALSSKQGRELEQLIQQKSFECELMDQKVIGYQERLEESSARDAAMNAKLMVYPKPVPIQPKTVTA
jgi:chromosome segregation ATPase